MVKVRARKNRLNALGEGKKQAKQGTRVHTGVGLIKGLYWDGENEAVNERCRSRMNQRLAGQWCEGRADGRSGRKCVFRLSSYCGGRAPRKRPELIRGRQQHIVSSGV